MAFTWFKKKRRRYGFARHPRVLNFGKSLTKEQKTAMAHVFLMVMKADGSTLNLKMYNYIFEQFESIGFGLKSKYMEAFESNDLDDTYTQINSLSNDQKRWFATALHAMLYEIDVKPTFHHIQYYLTLGKQTSNPYIK